MDVTHKDYKQQLDRANNVIGSFSFSPTTTDGPCGQVDIGVGDPAVLAKRIRRFVTHQYDRTLPNRPTCNSQTLDQVHPTLNSLSLELRRLASLHLMRKYMEMIPFLSSKFLDPDEQANLAFKCIFLEFSTGEIFTKHPEYGRGILILKRGMAIRHTCGHYGVQDTDSFQTFGIDDPIEVNGVLVEDCFLENEVPLYRFASYSSVVFIPRTVIYEVVNAKKAAWKHCARWRYLQTCLLKWSRDRKRLLPIQWSRDMDNDDVL